MKKIRTQLWMLFGEMLLLVGDLFESLVFLVIYLLVIYLNHIQLYPCKIKSTVFASGTSVFITMVVFDRTLKIRTLMTDYSQM